MPGSAHRKSPPSAASPSAYRMRRARGAKPGTTRSTETCAASGTQNAHPQKITHTYAIVASSSVHAAGLPNTNRKTTWNTRARNIAAKSPAPIQSAQRVRREAKLLDGVDALKQSPGPLFGVLGLEVRGLNRLAERIDVGRGDRDPLSAEEADQVLLLARAVVVVESRRRGRRLPDCGALGGGERAPGLPGDRELQRVDEVPGENDLPGHLVELRRFERRQRVVLGVYGPRLEAEIDLGEGERGGARAERLAEEQPFLRPRHAQLHPGEVGGRLHRSGLGEAELPRAEVHDLQQLDPHLLGDPGAH